MEEIIHNIQRRQELQSLIGGIMAENFVVKALQVVADHSAGGFQLDNERGDVSSQYTAKSFRTDDQVTAEETLERANIGPAAHILE